MVASALHQAEEALTVRIASRLSTAATVRLEELAAAAPDNADAEEEQGVEGPALLALIKSDPGNVSLESMLAEIGKLEAVRLVGLPDRKSTRLNSSHPSISYAVFCLKKKKKTYLRNIKKKKKKKKQKNK